MNTCDQFFDVFMENTRHYQDPYPPIFDDRFNERLEEDSLPRSRLRLEVGRLSPDGVSRPCLRILNTCFYDPEAPWIAKVITWDAFWRPVLTDVYDPQHLLKYLKVGPCAWPRVPPSTGTWAIVVYIDAAYMIRNENTTGLSAKDIHFAGWISERDYRDIAGFLNLNIYWGNAHEDALYDGKQDYPVD